MAEQGIDTAVVLYSVSNFITDRNLIYLTPQRVIHIGVCCFRPLK